MKRHKNADWIIQWANGVEVEMNAKINQGDPRGWFPVTNACSFENDTLEFRLKPKEAKWFENIPDHGVLCWAWDTKECNKRIDVIYSYKGLNHDRYPYNYMGRYVGWINATPLTNDEIERFKR